MQAEFLHTALRSSGSLRQQIRPSSYTRSLDRQAAEQAEFLHTVLRLSGSQAADQAEFLHTVLKSSGSTAGRVPTHGP